MDYATILNDKRVSQIYENIDGLAKQGDSWHWVYHGLTHVQNTIDIAKQLMPILDIDRDVQDAVLVALALHDIGKEYENEKNKRSGHAHSSYLFAQEYLAYQNIPHKTEILQAIKNHSEPTNDNSLISALVFACDKLDITSKRIAAHGRTIKGQRQFQYVLGHQFELAGKNLITNFVYADGFDRAEWDEFFKGYPKWTNVTHNACQLLGLTSESRFVSSATV